MFITEPEKLQFCVSAKRKWQGIPGIERTPGGRLFVSFYSGGAFEMMGNYCVLIKSDDDGAAWSEPIASAYIDDNSRCYDPGLWIDPLGRLWYYWSVYPHHAVWAARCDEPDADELRWTQPKKIGHDVMMNKPTVLSSGEWLFPVAVWKHGVKAGFMEESEGEERLSYVYCSKDQGETFERLGGADVPRRVYDEHMILEKRDGSLWMMVRTLDGIGQSISRDKGRTWSAGTDTGLGGPNSRFFLRRLSSGSILLLNHHDYQERNNLKAMISRDDGETWEGYLMLDARSQVSYPDAVEAADGFIYAVYDRERMTEKEIWMAKFTEEDILAGKIVHPGSRLAMLVNKAGEGITHA